MEYIDAASNRPGSRLIANPSSGTGVFLLRGGLARGSNVGLVILLCSGLVTGVTPNDGVLFLL